jgi:hypothetical protein
VGLIQDVGSLLGLIGGLFHNFVSLGYVLKRFDNAQSIGLFSFPAS